jgi:hypothetical protein
MAFAPCPSCRRHVRVDETACPFCGATGATLVATPDATTRMTRTRLFAFATTVGVTAATLACPSSGGGGGGNIAQPYGVPPRPEPTMVDGGADETTAIAPPATIEPPPPGTAPTLPNTAPTGKPPYGPGGPVAMYGAPPPPAKPIP